jgi:hypothetical protein
MPAAGPESWATGAARAWYEDDATRPYEKKPSNEFTGLLESDEEQVVRLGRAAGDPDARGMKSTDGPRAYPARSTRTAEARRFQPSGEHSSGRSNWPRVVALIAWIVLFMVVCWFYIFPWLERILPENF